MTLLNDSHNELIKAVKSNELIIFAGAGISKSAGLPLWNELIAKIIYNIKTNNEDHGKTLEAVFNNPSAKNRIFDALSLIENNQLQSFVNTTLEEEIFDKGNYIFSNHIPLNPAEKSGQSVKPTYTN